MFINTSKLAVCARRNLSFLNNNGRQITAVFPVATKKNLHTTTVHLNYAAAAKLPIPNNIDAAEMTKFSPQRSRDISATVILSQYGQVESMPTIDITSSDNSMAGALPSTCCQDRHLQSYDCSSSVNLNSAMQSNVPTPFGGMHKFSHLNMPGGQWSQENKFMSQNLHSSHYTTLRQNARSDWVAYDQNATIQRKELRTNGHALDSKRCYSTDIGAGKKPDLRDNVEVLSKKQQLKKAFKEYGATVIVFHVAISLASLGGCFLLVSSGIDMMPLLNYLGLSSSMLASKVATDASTFVVAYAIHKVFAPVRISITLGATPFIVRYMRSKGFLKPKIINPK